MCDLALLSSFVSAMMLSFQASSPGGPTLWDVEALSTPPVTHPAPGFQAQGVQSLLFEGLPWQGRPTRVFAWLGMPTGQKGKVPGIVLVHGGGGTAFEEWVRLWTDRGYAAIAMDTCGCTPGGEHPNRPRLADGGPPGWGGFDQMDWPREDQWTYHAVADILLSHSLLGAQPQVDQERIGLTGISWGGYLACIAAGVDPRFKFIVSVYGCGSIPDTVFGDAVRGLGEERAREWLSCWDPLQHLKAAKAPMLWVTGTNDFAYPLNALQTSYRSTQGPRTLSIQIRMPHGHGGPGENPEEIHAFADAIALGGIPLPRIISQSCDSRIARAVFQSDLPVVEADLAFTRDLGPWQDRTWLTTRADLDQKAFQVASPLPDRVTAYYFNLRDSRGLMVSTQHVEVSP